MEISTVGGRLGIFTAFPVVPLSTCTLLAFGAAQQTIAAHFRGGLTRTEIAVQPAWPARQFPRLGKSQRKASVWSKVSRPINTQRQRSLPQWDLYGRQNSILQAAICVVAIITKTRTISTALCDKTMDNCILDRQEFSIPGCSGAIGTYIHITQPRLN